jgi:large subunit ribosomal protein L35
VPANSKKSKLKTHKAAASRLYVTGTGKLMRHKGNRSHLRRKKSAKVRRTYHQKLAVASADVSRLKRLVP